MKPVDLATAKALQELGYDGECHLWYDREGKLKPIHLVYDDIPAPRLDDVAYWIMRHKWMAICIDYDCLSKLYRFSITPILYERDHLMGYVHFSRDYDTALEDAIKTAIIIIKKHNDELL